MRHIIVFPALYMSALLLGGQVLAQPEGHEGHGALHMQHEPAAEQTPWGIAGRPDQVERTVEIRMGDGMRFTPEALQIKQGETIRFVYHNDGKLMHEFVLGSRQTLDEHAEAMLRQAGMMHDEAYMVHVGPAQQDEMIWTFNRAGRFEFACLIAGHYQAGMRGSVEVVAQ